ncbi:hypothetical protein SAMD00019534_031980 [Acytostelium subglobosum LB1]|uniref:hypothetical protein n=1 Tax=Acytostelium subglobosum LB1 TaxID=1410327 RepID=UPI000644DB0F|nr:hypothetical protein SAMD00019534_031980 [Acytostelium subglobosum LB1]GAM20023.1 hypothetical protein SAMD00019534_031980 [Acytostelium subglobosum LB1]|eukprot:XP_012756785.1 hypothetical protein SAMD00019534_031980 [Acytostelium subglobosum LB1]
MSDQTDPGLPTQSIWDIPFENLEFKERIGKGSFGSVFRGTYLGLDVAIKKIEKADDPEYLKYIDREVSMLQSLRHPFIVQFSGICVNTSGLYIVTEYVSGGDVRQLLKQSPPITWERRISIAVDLAKVLVFLHAKKIIHRDLKSKNILVDEYQRIRLCDFGFARMNEHVKKNRHMTMCGTEGWVAPEILLGMSYDTSCDVFSYGVVLAELITGMKPGTNIWVRTPDSCFDINPDEMKQNALPGCPQKLIDLCLDCCKYEPSQRPKFDDVLSTIKNIVIPVEVKSPDTTATSAATAQTPQSQTTQTQTTQAPQQTLSPTMGQSRRAMSSLHRKSIEVISLDQKEFKGKSSGDSVLVTGTNNNWRVGAPKPAYQNLKKKTTNGTQTVSTSHLVKMIERATSDYCYDTSYIQDLLLTYPSFVTPLNLCDLLQQRYQSSAPDNHVGQVDNWKKVHRVIQLRVVIFIKRWIEHFPDDFQDPLLMEKLNEFDRIVVQNNMAALSLTQSTGTIVAGDSEPRLAGELSKKRESLTPAATSLIHVVPPESILPSPSALAAGEYLEVVDVSAIELARQFSLTMSTCYLLIQPREYLEICWEKVSDSPSPWVGREQTGRPGANIHAYLERYDDLVRLVSTEVVKHSSLAKRTATVERFIEAADKCLSFNDFSSVFCIMEGLANPSVERLTETFKALSGKAHATLDQLKVFVSKDNDFRRYRERLQNSQAPAFPYLKLLLEELYFIETSSPKLLPGGVINFFHYRELSRKILFAHDLTNSSIPHFKIVGTIQRLLNKPPQELFDDEVIRHYSLTCEPVSL